VKLPSLIASSAWSLRLKSKTSTLNSRALTAMDIRISHRLRLQTPSLLLRFVLTGPSLTSKVLLCLKSKHMQPPEVPTTNAPNQRFSGEVHYSASIKPRKPDGSTSTFPYVAVKSLHSLCSTCFNADSKETKTPCAGRRGHFITRCPRCFYYGHKLFDCLQTHSAMGEPLSDKKKNL